MIFDFRDFSLFDLNIILLTHSREVSKPSNTGRLIVESLGAAARTVIWERKAPDTQLLRRLETTNSALVYPDSEDATSTAISDFQTFIIIDSTWQEARKIYNHSPYLQALPKVSLTPSYKSVYSLRRNQVDNGLCTAECAIELLRARGQNDLASELNTRFEDFLEKNQKT